MKETNKRHRRSFICIVVWNFYPTESWLNYIGWFAYEHGVYMYKKTRYYHIYCILYVMLMIFDNLLWFIPMHRTQWVIYRYTFFFFHMKLKWNNKNGKVIVINHYTRISIIISIIISKRADVLYITFIRNTIFEKF